jgi:hypothetical protein
VSKVGSLIGELRRGFPRFVVLPAAKHSGAQSRALAISATWPVDGTTRNDGLARTNVTVNFMKNLNDHL